MLSSPCGGLCVGSARVADCWQELPAAGDYRHCMARLALRGWTGREAGLWHLAIPGVLVAAICTQHRCGGLGGAGRSDRWRGRLAAVLSMPPTQSRARQRRGAQHAQMLSRRAGQRCKGVAEAIDGAYIRRHRPSRHLHRCLRGQDRHWDQLDAGMSSWARQCGLT